MGKPQIGFQSVKKKNKTILKTDKCPLLRRNGELSLILNGSEIELVSSITLQLRRRLKLTMTFRSLSMSRKFVKNYLRELAYQKRIRSFSN